MATNPYNYDTTAPWIPQQNQLYGGRDVTAHTSQQRAPVLRNQRLPQTGGERKPRAPEKMPKARALALARTLKRWLVVASIVGFGTFSGLVAFHQIGSTTAASQSTSTSSGSSHSTSSSNSSSQNSNSFLNQGGNNFGSSSSSQGSASGSSVS